MRDKYLILVADDDKDTCEMMATLLRTEGYEVRTTQTISEAVRMAKEGRFDLYIHNHLLLDGTGVDLMRQIRAFDRHTPVIFYSGVGTYSAKGEAFDAGAQEYILKPHINQLLQVISAVIYKKRG
jgi:DNA-binding response OmpR family regulator